MHMYADEGGYRSTYSAIEHGSTYLFFGSGISSGTWLQPDVILIKTDPLGDTVATRELNFPDLAVTAGLGNSLIELHDGGMLLVGSAQPNGSLFRAGHLIWFVSSLDTIRTLMVVDTFDVDLNAVIEMRTQASWCSVGEHHQVRSSFGRILIRRGACWKAAITPHPMWRSATQVVAHLMEATS